MASTETAELSDINLTRICDELESVELGLNGFLTMICQGGRKKLVLNPDEFYFAIFPLREKLTAVNKSLDLAHQKMRGF